MHVTFPLLVKWQLCIHCRPALVYLYSVMHCYVHRGTILEGWGINRVLFRTSFLVYCSWSCHTGFSIRMETPSSWVSICQFINLRSESVSVQVIVCKAWGLVLCPQWLPPQFLLPHPVPWLVTKSCHHHCLLRHILHPAEQTRNPVVDGNSCRRMGAIGWEQSPSRRDGRLDTGILMTVDRSFHLSVCLNDLLWK